MLTKFFIRDLAVPCIIGIVEAERQEKQFVIINIDMWATLDHVFTTDAIEDTFNYKDLYMEVVTLVTTSQFHLVEVLADAIATLCMQQEKTTLKTRPSILGTLKVLIVPLGLDSLLTSWDD